MKSDKVSVIVPVYNVEQWLPRCLDSILGQTYKNIEIILVDDGSSDNCPQICDEYQKKNNNIKVIHKNNGGLASARNAGLCIADGEYVLFVDSDDWIEFNAVDELLKIIDNREYDYVRFRACYAGWPGKTDGTVCDFGNEYMLKEGEYTREQIIADIYPFLLGTPQLTLGPIVSAWRSIYRKDFLINNALYFDEDVKYSEDTIFSARVVRATKKMYYLKEKILYHYFFNINSITKSAKTDRWEVAKKLMACFEHYFKDDKEYDFTNQLLLQHMYGVLNAINERKNIKDFSCRYRYCKDIILDPTTKKVFKNIDLADVTIKLKIHLLLIKCRMVLPFVFI